MVWRRAYHSLCHSSLIWQESCSFASSLAPVCPASVSGEGQRSLPASEWRHCLATGLPAPHLLFFSFRQRVPLLAAAPPTGSTCEQPQQQQQLLLLHLPSSLPVTLMFSHIATISILAVCKVQRGCQTREWLAGNVSQVSRSPDTLFSSAQCQRVSGTSVRSLADWLAACPNQLGQVCSDSDSAILLTLFERKKYQERTFRTLNLLSQVRILILNMQCTFRTCSSLLELAISGDF